MSTSAYLSSTFSQKVTFFIFFICNRVFLIFQFFLISSIYELFTLVCLSNTFSLKVTIFIFLYGIIFLILSEKDLRSQNIIYDNSFSSFHGIKKSLRYWRNSWFVIERFIKFTTQDEKSNLIRKSFVKQHICYCNRIIVIVQQTLKYSFDALNKVIFPGTDLFRNIKSHWNRSRKKMGFLTVWKCKCFIMSMQSHYSWIFKVKKEIKNRLL